jgi:hypothetical protein
MTDQPAEQSGAHRRRRRRATSAQGAPQQATDEAPVPRPPAAPAAAVAPSEPAVRQSEPPRRRAQSARDSGERGLRDLVGGGQSQLGVSGALRGRDVNRPTEDDLAEAEREVQIVRRHWTPPPS